MRLKSVLASSCARWEGMAGTSCSCALYFTFASILYNSGRKQCWKPSTDASVKAYSTQVPNTAHIWFVVQGCRDLYAAQAQYLAVGHGLSNHKERSCIRGTNHKHQECVAAELCRCGFLSESPTVALRQSSIRVVCAGLR